MLQNSHAIINEIQGQIYKDFKKDFGYMPVVEVWEKDHERWFIVDGDKKYVWKNVKEKFKDELLKVWENNNKEFIKNIPAKEKETENFQIYKYIEKGYTSGMVMKENHIIEVVKYCYKNRITYGDASYQNIQFYKHTQFIINDIKFINRDWLGMGYVVDTDDTNVWLCEKEKFKILKKIIILMKHKKVKWGNIRCVK